MNFTDFSTFFSFFFCKIGFFIINCGKEIGGIDASNQNQIMPTSAFFECIILYYNGWKIAILNTQIFF